MSNLFDEMERGLSEVEQVMDWVDEVVKVIDGPGTDAEKMAKLRELRTEVDDDE